MILKNLFLKKKIKMNTMKKKITRKKKSTKKKSTSFFAKIPEYMEYFVYVTDWYCIVIHVTLYTTERERESERLGREPSLLT